MYEIASQYRHIVNKNLDSLLLFNYLLCTYVSDQHRFLEIETEKVFFIKQYTNMGGTTLELNRSSDS